MVLTYLHQLDPGEFPLHIIPHPQQLTSTTAPLARQAKLAAQAWWLDNVRHMGMDQYLLIHINTIFRGMNIHLPAILM